MNQIAITPPFSAADTIRREYFAYCMVFLGGLIGPLGFAPFHLPGLTILGLAIFFATISRASSKKAFYLGATYGLGFFGFGVSWVIISIHDYGQLNYLLSGLATLLFVAYLSLFPAITAYLYSRLRLDTSDLHNLFLFALLWTMTEYLRACFLTGFPWLLIGVSQLDTPLKALAPIVGIYGLGFLSVLCAGFLAMIFKVTGNQRLPYTLALICILLAPKALESRQWTVVGKKPLSVGAIQANLSMRDKWDEALFWNLLKYYEKATNRLLGKEVIILPESAIPLPARYLQDYLENLHQKAKKAKSALILGILQPVDETENQFYNAIITLGRGHGSHIKHQLVPFGEYIPGFFATINHWLQLPEPNILPGKLGQKLISILNHPIASLICYEIAYPDILRQQMPEAQWIIAISDNGWFGRSLASYQQLQMSQMLSLMTGRYQIVVNNDGLSSVINTKGDIVDSLPPFTAGILESAVYPAKGTTPWVLLSNYPMMLFCSIYLVFALYRRFKQD